MPNREIADMRLSLRRHEKYSERSLRCLQLANRWWVYERRMLTNDHSNHISLQENIELSAGPLCFSIGRLGVPLSICVFFLHKGIANIDSENFPPVYPCLKNLIQRGRCELMQNNRQKTVPKKQFRATPNLKKINEIELEFGSQLSNALNNQ